MRLSRSSRQTRGGLLVSAVLSILAAVPATGAPAAPSAMHESHPITDGHGHDLELNGTAALITRTGTGKRIIQLTAGGYKQIGSAWSTGKVDLDRSFSTSFKAFLHHNRPGGDGIAFLAQGHGPRALGGWGGGLGYRGIRRSVAVEFDTFQNSTDPNSNHLAVVLGGNPDRHLKAVTASIPLYGKPFQARITYGGADHRLRVYVRGLYRTAKEKLMLDERVDVARETGVRAGWLGFTGATGDRVSHQDVYDWTVDAPQA
ncbi:lectin [Actinoplanes sp. SE50]|uniref:L-type lectin-domain containing protein n=1 Tax=unclassified Actinoplanes TaxID=2626549 RepID=UPI00023ECF70|nr:MULTISPECIES: L-type lectin-domain containing protein [unclassified Actinoplanes]AEV87792.1 Lectin-related protein [Actinoplanes sp. SE50/110]ATO86194.1 lectin [Actinoplanes sp. SE50]SLM03608.1 lectin [Actinoplanes sp. SE50/110]